MWFVCPLKNILLWFEACSGLRVNTSKTVLYKVNKVEDWEAIVDVWRSKQDTFPDVYLGLPLGAKFKCVAVWDSLIGRIRKRLALWKRRYLSKGGQLVLIMSTLQNIPVYMLSSRLAPVSMIDENEKIVRLFLWGTMDGKRKMQLIAFEGVCLLFVLGGLGLKRVREINLSLLCKWFWRLREDTLWVKLLKEKYGVEPGGFFPRKSKLPVGVSVWRRLYKVEELFKDLTMVKIGNGMYTSFWWDKWCSDIPLARIFPKFHAVSSSKQAIVADILTSMEADTIHRELFGIDENICEDEPEQFFLLNYLVRNMSMSGNEDRRLWCDGSDKFTVAVCYTNILQWRRKSCDPGSMAFNWGSVWNRLVPSKVSFLVWLIVRTKILTHDELQHRGFNMVSKCFMCGSDSECLDHLFSTCSMAQKLWNYFEDGSRLGLSQRSFTERLVSWCPHSKTAQGSIIKKHIPHAIAWTFWRERNRRCFDEEQLTYQQLIVVIKECLWSWCLGLKETKSLQFEKLVFDWDSL